jgi:SPP1 family predicted phage head-tail adaptor
MEAGKLRYRVTLQQLTTTTDAEGIPIESWLPFATVHAAVEPIKGREYFQAAAVGAENTVRIRIRYRSGVTAAMRLLYGTRIFNIRSVIDDNERHWEIHLMCEEVVSGN